MNKIVIGLSALIIFVSCQNSTNTKEGFALSPDEGNAGLILPDGFNALVVVDNIGAGNQIAVNKNGDIYMTLKVRQNEKAIVAIRDENNDGKADLIRYFGNQLGTGIEIYNGYLYLGTETSILRYQFSDGALLPDTVPEVVVSGLSNQEFNSEKSITIDLLGNLYVSIGAPSNACELHDDSLKGMDPCSQLEWQAGIWKFSANKIGQQHKSDGMRYATGIRNTPALKWNKAINKLYGVQNGHDKLYDNFPNLYAEKEGVGLPAEEFLLIEEGDDFGWPYCYYDPFEVSKVLAPEYGGNGTLVGRCENAKDPILAFPSHMQAYNMDFYLNGSFPEVYKNGAFITFIEDASSSISDSFGDFVAFVPFSEMFPIGQWEVFAKNSEDSNFDFRFTGLALGPEGSLYFSGSEQGKIWRVFYSGVEKK